MRRPSLTVAMVLTLVMVLTAWSDLRAQSGEPDSFSTYSLGDLVVSAERPYTRKIATINVITAEEIEATNSKSVAEALRFAPGVMVTTGRKNEPEIQVHGLGQEKILVLIDGVPYYETSYGYLNLDQIPTDIIARIEVTKGAPSVLYGANAQIAVVNIITKTAGDKPSFTVTGEIGEGGTYKFSVSNGMKLGHFNYWFNYTRRQSEGWRMSDDFEPKVGTITRGFGRAATTENVVLEDGGYRNNSDERSDSLWLRVGAEPTPQSEYYINFHMIGSERGFPPSTDDERVFPDPPAFSNLARFNKYDDWGADFSGRQQFGSMFTLKAKIFYHSHEDDYVSYEDLTYEEKEELAVSTYKDYFFGTSLIGELDFNPRHALRFSFHYKGDSHKERNDRYLPFASMFSHTYSLGTEYDYRSEGGLGAVAGVSYDWVDVSKAQAAQTDRRGNLTSLDDLQTPDVKSELNPMVGLTYSLSDSTRLFGSVAIKTRFPTLSQLYSSRSGNRDLQAEKSTNYTFGLAQKFGQVADLEASVFYHDITDWISRDGPEMDNIYRNYANIRIMGLELTGRLRPTDNLTITADCTLSQGSDESQARVTDKVTRLPDIKAGLGVSYLIPVILTKIDLRGLYEGETYSQLPTPQDPTLEEDKTDSHFLVNARISKEIFNHFEVYFAVDNLFDVDYESETAFPGPGRNCLLGVTARY